jgi:deaminated glutathione amidase
MIPFKLACVQMTSGADMAANIAQASALIRAARGAGADLIATPENTGVMAHGGERVIAAGRAEDDHPALAAFRALARETGAWLLVGSLWIKRGDAGRNVNRSYLIGADGGIAAAYDKIHMFDVDLPSGEKYRESKNFAPGDTARVAATPWGLLGMTVCYDLRFPQLYRALAQAGAALIAIPSSFTQPTGEAHWHVLVRARAIETGAFVFAPAQCGVHPGERRTYGHSLIVDPWGKVLADGGESPGFVVADIDVGLVAKARASIPAWRSDAPFSLAGAAKQAAE